MTNETARISAYRGSPELLTLTAVAGLALTAGLVVFRTTGETPRRHTEL